MQQWYNIIQDLNGTLAVHVDLPLGKLLIPLSKLVKTLFVKNITSDLNGGQDANVAKSVGKVPIKA